MPRETQRGKVGPYRCPATGLSSPPNNSAYGVSNSANEWPKFGQSKALLNGSISKASVLMPLAILSNHGKPFPTSEPPPSDRPEPPAIPSYDKLSRTDFERMRAELEGYRGRDED